MKKIVLCLLAACSSLTSTQVLAWRETGHFVVCQIAWNHMTATAKKAVRAITNNQPFAEQCTWPDMVRKSADWKHTYNWHFINLDDGQSYFDKTTIDPQGDVLRALQQASEVLSSDVTTTADKKHWLRFVGHFTGDMHQPLHVGRKSDLGGNNIKVTWFGDSTYQSVEILQAAPAGQPCTGIASAFVHQPTGECVVKNEKPDSISLHKVWDLQLIERYKTLAGIQPAAGDSEYAHVALAKNLDRGFDQGTVGNWQKQYFDIWADESLADRAEAYATGGSNLGDHYYNKNIDYVRMRLVQAGYRLAAFMNRTFDRRSFGLIRASFFDLSYLELKERISKLLGP
jgi:hypothetical protein